MISVALARKLRDAGLRWNPASGDRFVVADRDMDDEVFTLADVIAEVHEFPSGRVIGFNGTVEWALDSVEAHNSVWLPSEGQLRERLAGTFRRLSLADGRWLVEIEVAGAASAFESHDPEEAYGQALLYLITGEPAP